jgi:hypothetical protein
MQFVPHFPVPASILKRADAKADDSVYIDMSCIGWSATKDPDLEGTLAALRSTTIIEGFKTMSMMSVKAENEETCVMCYSKVSGSIPTPHSHSLLTTYYLLFVVNSFLAHSLLPYYSLLIP